jgi:hypothetical protein
VIFYNARGIESQLLIDVGNVLNAEQDIPVDYSTVAEPTNIISDGKLCDPNVQQYSGYIHFSGFLGQKSYFFWLLESRSNPSTDPLVVWLTGGPGVNISGLMAVQYSIMQAVHLKWLCWLKMGLAGPMSMEMEQFQMSSLGQTKQM